MTGVKLPVGFSFCRETQQILKVPKSGSSPGRWLSERLTERGCGAVVPGPAPPYS